MKAFLTATECARALAVSKHFIYGEIEDGRLQAEVVVRPPRSGRRRGYRRIRIYQAAWASYLLRDWPNHPETFHVSQKSSESPEL